MKKNILLNLIKESSTLGDASLQTLTVAGVPHRRRGTKQREFIALWFHHSSFFSCFLSALICMFFFSFKFQFIPILPSFLLYIFLCTFTSLDLFWENCFWPHPWHMEVPRLGGLIQAVAPGLFLSHNNARSDPCLWPTPQLMATPDP